ERDVYLDSRQERVARGADSDSPVRDRATRSVDGSPPETDSGTFEPVVISEQGSRDWATCSRLYLDRSTPTTCDVVQFAREARWRELHLHKLPIAGFLFAHDQQLWRPAATVRQGVGHEPGAADCVVRSSARYARGPGRLRLEVECQRALAFPDRAV